MNAIISSGGLDVKPSVMPAYGIAVIGVIVVVIGVVVIVRYRQISSALRESSARRYGERLSRSVFRGPGMRVAGFGYVALGILFIYIGVTHSS